VIRTPFNIWPPHCVVALLLFTFFTPVAAAQDRRHVLLVYGSEKDLPMNLIIDSKLRSTFRETLGDGVELYSEYLDVSRFPDNGYPRKMLEFLHGKYSERRLDLIVGIESSIPDFARGPDSGHVIKVPNDKGFGIPVTHYNAAKVTDVTFTLSYNPSLLNVTAEFSGANSDATDPAGSFTISAPTIVDASHAIATFHFHDNTPQSLTVVLGDIQATVPGSAASDYKDKELLQIGNIVVNQGAITGTVNANGVHVNAYFGDVTGNGTIDGLDVATALDVARGKDTGFAAYHLLDPAIVGDPAVDFSVDAGDISDLAAYNVHLPTPSIPAIPTGHAITPVGADPTLRLGSGFDDIGGIMTVGVMLDHPHPNGSTGMTQAILALTYDRSVLSVLASDITLGSIPGQGTGWQLTSEVDQATGQIGIDLYSTKAITASQAGSLVNIAFHLVPGATPPATAIQLMSSVMPNNHQFETQVDDAQGRLVLTTGAYRIVIPTGVSPGESVLDGQVDERLAQTTQVEAPEAPSLLGRAERVSLIEEGPSKHVFRPTLA
jgi:hypothetical protein